MSDGLGRAPSMCGDDIVGRVIRAALASLPHMSVLMVDTTLRYRAALGAALTSHGYRSEDVVGRLVVDVLPPAAYERIGPLFRRALRGETFTDIAPSADGTAIYETDFGPAVEDGEVVGAVAVVRDVTVEQRALAELASTDELHQTLMGNVSDMIAVTAVSDGRYVWVSPSSERVTGWRAPDLVGRSVFDYVHPDDLAVVRERRGDLVLGEQQVAIEYRYRRHGGGWMWVEGNVRPITDEDGTVTTLVTTLRDVTERRQLEAQLTQANAVFEVSFAAAPIGMALVGIDGRWLKVNDALCELLGRDGPTLLAGTFQDLTHPEDLVADLGLVREVLDGTRDGYRMEKRYLRPDGTVVWAQLAVALVRDENRNPQFFISQVEDVTERRNAQQELERLATTDPLTGLPNRLLLTDRLRHALDMARRSGWLVGVVFIDLDRFKEVNDRFGHDAGDELLRQVATRLSRSTRSSDTTTRLGGDEFVVVCEQVTATDEVTQVAARISAELSRPFTVFGHDVEISASIGVTTGDSDSAETLLRDADRSMYAAKHHGGGGQVDVYAEARGAIASEQLRLHAELRDGITRGELRVHYQPIVELRTGAVTAREALVRWAHPTRGLLAPAEFLDGIDRSALGLLLGETVLRQACTDAARWPDLAVVHVNVSARQLAQPGFAELVGACLDATGLTAGRLVLEITENLILTASRSTLTSTAALTELGVALSLDDFGTGFSSITALHRLPIGSLKIDRSFVADLPADPVSAALVDGLIDLGRHMGLGVVAEGIETAEQAEWLTDHGCPHGQGYHYGRPAATPF
jgi:diguanylate cyclase (GGDEF)-like protein/PAS domain S-box-containing protein